MKWLFVDQIETNVCVLMFDCLVILVTALLLNIEIRVNVWPIHTTFVSLDSLFQQMEVFICKHYIAELVPHTFIKPILLVWNNLL